MIQVSHLQKKFGSFTAVDDLSFQVETGEILGFLGPNGAGKTTTMRMITGFLRPDSGQVKIFDYEIVRQPLSAKRIIGYLPEGAPAYGDMTVAAFLDFIGRVRGLRGPDLNRRIEHVIESLALGPVRNRRIDLLSKGFKRRVGLAQAIIHRPRALILDEPTDGLDPNQKSQVRKLIRNLVQECIIIVSTHLLEEVTAVCTRALIIAQGRPVFDGTPGDLEKRSRFHGAIALRLKTSQSARAFINLPGVAAVESDPLDPNRIILLPEPGIELFSCLQSWLLENQDAIIELNSERGRLEEVFQALTTNADHQSPERTLS